MKKSEPAKKRTQRFFAKQTKGGAKGWSYSDAPDPRQQGKIDHPAAECPERDGFPILSWTQQGGWVQITPATVRGALGISRH